MRNEQLAGAFFGKATFFALTKRASLLHVTHPMSQTQDIKTGHQVRKNYSRVLCYKTFLICHVPKFYRLCNKLVWLCCYGETLSLAWTNTSFLWNPYIQSVKFYCTGPSQPWSTKELTKVHLHVQFQRHDFALSQPVHKNKTFLLFLKHTLA